VRALPPAVPGTPDHRSATRYLWWLATRAWPSLVAGICWAVLWFLVQAVTPLVLGKAIDAGLTAKDMDALLRWGLVLLALGGVQALAGIARHRMAVFNWLSAAMRTVQLAVRRANHLGGTLPRRIDAGEVVAIGTADLNHLGGAVDITARGSGAFVAVVVVTVIMLVTSVPLGLVVLIGVPVLMAVAGLLIRPLHGRQERYRDRQGRLTGRATDIVGGLRVLRGVGGEAVMAARYRAESQQLRASGVRVARVESLLEAAQVLLPGIFLALVTWLGARFAIEGRLTVGQLVSFYGFAAFLVAPLRTLTEALDKLTRGHVAAGRVKRLLDTERDLPEPAAPRAWPVGAELADPASGVRLRPGEFTVLAAAAPAEAHTVADRLGRHIEGAVTADGVPLTELALATVRRHVLVADNDARLFSGPLRADLAPGGRDPAAALAVACADDIVAALPDGLDTPVAERGRTFSGGQQQRLRLARALLADPEVLILVEPTSAVDAHTEARIAASLRDARAGRTTLVCSTSPLVLDRADRVLFLLDGVVAADGSHRDLLATDPRYARTVTREED
jgi:ABC-type multidrug transport system fused ATPase/permease subunit